MKRNVYFVILVVLVVLVSTFYMAKYVEDKNDKRVLNSNPQYINYQKEEEVSKLIKRINRINDAKVCINTPLSSSGKAVSVVLYSNEKVSKEKIDEIINLLTKNIDSLDKKKIEVVNDNMEILFPVE